MIQPISTRERLIQYLRIQGPLTAADLVEFLEITPTAVRQHLDRLEAEGWVGVTGLRRGRGRPRKVYALTPRSDHLFPQSYDSLALDLLEAIGRLPDGAQLLERVLATRREIWKERYGSRLNGKPLDRQLDEVTALFNEKGGLTDYELQPDGTYLLTKRNCNISSVTVQHPRFCQEERGWLQDVLQRPVEALQSRATGGAACIFRIMPPPDPSKAGQGSYSGQGE
jgi:predicted ArsR family transcriptional regulator